MQFRSGMLGVTVAALALAAAIIGAWALSTDVNEVEVTTYDPIADISGLFETSKTPEYIEYSPSANYTGYYTPDSIVNGVKYFAGVNYTESTRANNYRLNLTPEISLSETITLSDYTGTYPFDDEDFQITIGYVDSDTGFKRSYTNTDDNGVTVVSLSSYIAAMDLADGVNLLTIKSLADISDSDFHYGTQTDVDWILFTTAAAWYENADAYHCIVETADYFQAIGMTPGSIAEYYGNQVNLPFLSCSVDLDSQTVKLYTDNDLTDLVGIFSLTDVIMVYGGTASGSIYMNWDDEADAEASEVQTVYMDPSKGVRLT